jgi:putative endonuclease
MPLLLLPELVRRLVSRLVLVRDWLFPPRTFGQRGEDAAARFLKRLGYVIVARGQRDKLGEIDIIAVDGRTVVFVEVKTRASADAGEPHEAVTPLKQQKMTNVALGYLRRHQLLEHAARFDVVALTWPSEAKRPRIEHFRSAFEPPGRGQMFT